MLVRPTVTNRVHECKYTGLWMPRCTLKGIFLLAEAWAKDCDSKLHMGKVAVCYCKLTIMQFKQCKRIIGICRDIIVLSISHANIIIFNKSFYISWWCVHPFLMIFLTDHTDFLIFIHLVLYLKKWCINTFSR